MRELVAQLDQFTEEAHNVTEFLVLDLAEGVTDDQARETILSDWAAANGHALRASGEQNPFCPLVGEKVEGWLADRHFEDIVYRTVGPDQKRSSSAAAELVARIGPADYRWSDFIIDDWTFCDVLVITQPLRSIVIAFLGED